VPRASKKCACGEPVYKRRVRGESVTYTECKGCLALNRINDVVTGLTNHELRYVDNELRLLRKLEAIVRASEPEASDEMRTTLRELSVLREVAAK
jgi:hypothetical protein